MLPAAIQPGPQKREFPPIHEMSNRTPVAWSHLIWSHLMNLRPSTRASFGAVISFFLCFHSTALEARKVYFNGFDYKDGYYIVPDDLSDHHAKAWVAVDVHGAKGLKNDKRGDDLAALLGPEPIIVIVPSFTSGYQSGDGEWAKQLIENFKTVSKSHDVHDGLFVHGHSGGAQFAHRFAFTEPRHVIGVSAVSAGSWACDGGYGKISARAKGIPFSIGCGENDTAYSVPGYPHTRVEWYRLFAKQLEKADFVMVGGTFPGVGHGVPRKFYASQMRECFLLATQGIIPTSGKWTGDVEKLAIDRQRKYGRPPAAATALPTADHAALVAATSLIASGKSPDIAATLRFLVKHPAPSWVDHEEYAALKAHCKSAAESYLKRNAADGSPLTGFKLENFNQVTEGLGVNARQTKP